jgi:protease II
MRKRVGNDSSSDVVIDQNDIAKSHSYVGVMNERLSRDSGQTKVAFAVDTDGRQLWQVSVRRLCEQVRPAISNRKAVVNLGDALV